MCSSDLQKRHCLLRQGLTVLPNSLCYAAVCRHRRFPLCIPAIYAGTVTCSVHLPQHKYFFRYKTFVLPCVFSQIYMICESPQNRCFIALSDADDHKSDHERTVFGQLKKDSVRLSSRWMTTNLTTKKNRYFRRFLGKNICFHILLTQF